MSPIASARLLALVAAGAALAAAGPASAAHRHHHHRTHRAFAPAYGYAPTYGYQRYDASGAPQAYGGYYGAGGWEAQANAAATARAYQEPGLTLELAPDAKLTATGGPVGGVPGFSGR